MSTPEFSGTCPHYETSLNNSAAGKATLKWNRNTKATGYEICYKLGTNKTCFYIKNNTTVSKTISNLIKGKTYAFYVRSYKTVNGKNYYSAWSTAKKVKITK